jgi:phthiodiolone/phenolphthiodiolone dimycocerosates ketoreductase
VTQPMQRALRIGVPGSQLPIKDVARPVAAAEEAGFDSVWWADRMMGWQSAGPHALLDPFPLMAVAGASTRRIALGTAVADPLRRHPAQLAQTALTTQFLSGGRLLLGLGCGEAAGTLPYGIGYDRPVSRLEEALEVLRLLWSNGEPVDFDGTYYQLSGAVCGLAGQVSAPPVWLAAHGPRTLRLTGRVADGWLPTAHGVSAYARELDRVRAAESEHGRPAGSVEAGAFVWVVVADSAERARRLMHEPALRALGLLMPQGALSSSPFPDGPWRGLVPTAGNVDTLVAAVDPDELASLVPHGTPDEVAELLSGYVRAGAEHLVLCDMAPASGADTGLGLRPMQVYAAVRDRLLARTVGRPPHTQPN